MYYDNWVCIEELNGKVIKSVTGLEKDSEEVFITTECGQEYKMYHEQDCCENVYLSDIEGDASDLVGGLVISAEERSNSGDEDSDNKPSDYCESFTWTFYDIQTTKGSVWMRWLGESNGFYGEGVDIRWLNKPE